MKSRLSHIGTDGTANMVDIRDKPVTRRRAVAEATVRCSQELLIAIRANTVSKGDLLATARIAGIQGAKRVDALIPLCHALSLEHVGIDFELIDHGVRIIATASTNAKTGVEMEALTGAAVAALTVIDMGKSIDKQMVIERIRVLEKTGGRSGDFRADMTSTG